MHRLALFLPLLVIGAGCSGSQSLPDAAAEERSDGTDGGGDNGADLGGCGESCPPVDPQALPGVYAMLQVNSRIVTLPVLGDSRSETRALQRATVEARDEQSLLMTIEVCNLAQVTENSVVQVVFPAAFVANLESYQRTIEFRPEYGANGFASPLAVEIYSARLTDPANEALPTEGSDSRVYDQDKDTKPGVTICVTGLVDGEIWLVQRNKNTLTGNFLSADRWAGLIEGTMEQVYLGSDNPSLSKPNPSYEDPDASRSFIKLVRIDPQKQCSWIRQTGEELFQ